MTRIRSRRHGIVGPGIRWTLDGGIGAEVARDVDRGVAPGQTDTHGQAVDLFDVSREHHIDVDGEAPVTCWCEKTIVHVPLELVRAGLTYACDAERCRALEAKACSEGQEAGANPG